MADKVQKSLGEFKRVSKILSLKAFRPFTSAEVGLENINDVSEGAAKFRPLPRPVAFVFHANLSPLGPVSFFRFLQLLNQSLLQLL